MLYKLKARLSTSKVCTTCFIVILGVLAVVGTTPTVSPRFACVNILQFLSKNPRAAPPLPRRLLPRSVPAAVQRAQRWPGWQSPVVNLVCEVCRRRPPCVLLRRQLRLRRRGRGRLPQLCAHGSRSGCRQRPESFPYRRFGSRREEVPVTWDSLYVYGDGTVDT